MALEAQRTQHDKRHKDLSEQLDKLAAFGYYDGANDYQIMRTGWTGSPTSRSTVWWNTDETWASVYRVGVRPLTGFTW